MAQDDVVFKAILQDFERLVRSQSHPKTLKMHSLDQTPSRSHSSWPMYNTSSNVGAVGRKPPSLRQSFLMCDRLHAFAILAHRLLDRHYWLVENLTLSQIISSSAPMAPESFIPLFCLAPTPGCLCRRFHLEMVTLCKILQISLRKRIGSLSSRVANKALPPPPSSTPSTPSDSTLLPPQALHF